MQWKKTKNSNIDQHLCLTQLDCWNLISIKMIVLSPRYRIPWYQKPFEIFGRKVVARTTSASLAELELNATL